jgi:hypothetical protein
MMDAATRGRRHPHQVLIAIILVFVGIPILAGGPTPGSILVTLPPVLVYVWASMFVVGGTLIVAAAAVRSNLVALYLELVADLPVAMTAVTYSIAVTIVNPSMGLATWALYGACAGAFL